MINSPPELEQVPEPVPDYETQDDPEFNLSVQMLVNSLKPMHESLVNFGDWVFDVGQIVEQLAIQVRDGALSTEEFALIARGVANFKGLWSSLSGAQALGITAEHNNKIWLLRQAVSEIQHHEPSASSPVWRDTTIDSGVLVVSNPEDVRPDRVTNVGWNFKRAMLDRDAVLEDGADAVDIDVMPIGSCVLARQGGPGTFPAPVPGEWGYWHITRQRMYGHWFVDYAIAYQYRSGQPPMRIMTRNNYNTEAVVLSEWREIGGAGDGQSSTSEKVVHIAPPVRSEEYIVGGNVYGVDKTLDFSVANIFTGFTSSVVSALPPGSQSPLGLGGNNGFRLRFILTGLPENSEKIQIKYLQWAGLMRAGGGGAILDFVVPAGWSWTWKAGLTGTATAPTLSSVNPPANGKREELQLEINSVSRVVSISRVGWS